LIHQGAAIRVANAVELGDAVARLFADPAARQRMGTAALTAMQSERGAVARIIAIIDQVMR